MATFDFDTIRERIRRACIHEADLPPAVAADVAFHMTDWLEDLAALADFYSNPDTLTDERLAELMMAFLTHAPNHLAAAAKLYADLPVEDVFNVGSIKSED